MHTGEKGYLLLSQHAPGATSRGKNFPYSITDPYMEE